MLTTLKMEEYQKKPRYIDQREEGVLIDQRNDGRTQSKSYQTVKLHKPGMM